MDKPIMIVGIGEIGGVFAKGFLKTGYMVIPISRETVIDDLAKKYPDPELILIAVNESSLQDVLKKLPAMWSKKIVLVQNELLPKDYSILNDPTVISIWFEKKKGQDSKEIISSPVNGPKADILKIALNSLGLAVNIVKSHDDMIFELVVKNVYILTTNIAGLKVGGNVEGLWKDNNDLMQNVFRDVLSIQQALLNKKINEKKVLKSLVIAFEGDLQHKCMGRSAPERLRRAISDANKFQLEIPTLREIHKNSQ
mgnify:CR=1 FL=1